MRLVLVAVLAATLLAAPLAQAAPIKEPPIAFRAVTNALTLLCDDSPLSLQNLLASPRGLDRGERRLFDETLDDALSLLEFEEIPVELIGRMAVQKLGPIEGARITDLPRDSALAAVALGGGPIPVDALRSYDVGASVRNAPIGESTTDIQALLAGEDG